MKIAYYSRPVKIVSRRVRQGGRGHDRRMGREAEMDADAAASGLAEGGEGTEGRPPGVRFGPGA